MDKLMLAQACNTMWANQRLYTTVCGLSEQEFTGPAVGFFGSICATLQHVLEVDRFYIDALEAGGLGEDAWSLPVPQTALSLWAEQRAWDQRLVEVCRDTPATVSMDRGRRGHIVDHADRILLHLFQHQIHHRGQVHAMLSATSAQPPQLDEFYCSAEAHLRADELATLGLTEGDINACFR